MDAQDAASVLTVGASLTAEAGGPAGILQRAIGEVDDLILVVTGKGHLRGTDQVHIVGRQVVNLIGVLAQETSAGHNIWANQNWRDHQLEASFARLLRREHQHSQLQEGAIASEVVETSAAYLGATLDVDEAEGLAQLKVVLWLEVELRNLAYFFYHYEVIFAAGRGTFDHVIELVLQLLHLGFSGRLCLFRLLDLGLQLIRALQQCRSLLRGGLANLLAKSLLLRAQFVGLLDSSAALLISFQELVYEGGILTSVHLGSTDNVGVFAE